MNKSIFTDEEAFQIYCKIYDWLTGYTPGNQGCIERYKRYQIQAWDIVYKKIMNADVELGKIAKETFLYDGEAYRLHSNTKKNKGYVKEIKNYCVSWSKDLQSLNSVTNLYGKCILIITETKDAIDTFGLLEYLCQFNKHFVPRDKPLDALYRYEKEGEVLYPINFDQVKDVMFINHDDLLKWNTKGEKISKNLWSKTKIN